MRCAAQDGQQAHDPVCFSVPQPNTWRDGRQKKRPEAQLCSSLWCANVEAVGFVWLGGSPGTSWMYRYYSFGGGDVWRAYTMNK